MTTVVEKPIAGFAANGTHTPNKPAGIWAGKNIGVIVVTGEKGEGKTLFCTTIDPANTLVYDNEGSSADYESLGFERVDVAAELIRKYPGKNAKPIDRFLWWRDDVKVRVQPGKFSVVVVDPASEIESGLTQYVKEHPAEFGYTKSQFDQAAPLFWGAVKDFWKSILDDLRTRCETICLTVHMRDEFKGGRPTGKREAKGKETLFELASLYLEMERPRTRTAIKPMFRRRW